MDSPFGFRVNLGEEFASSSAEPMFLGCADEKLILNTISQDMTVSSSVSSLPISISPSVIKLDIIPLQYCPSPNIHPLRSPLSKPSPLSLLSPSLLNISLFAPEEKTSADIHSTSTQSDDDRDRNNQNCEEIDMKADKCPCLQTLSTITAPSKSQDPSAVVNKCGDDEISHGKFPFDKEAYAKLSLTERLASYDSYSSASGTASCSSSSASTDSGRYEGFTVLNLNARSHLPAPYQNDSLNNSTWNSFDSHDYDSYVPRGLMLNRRVKAVAALLDSASNRITLNNLTDTKNILQNTYENTLTKKNDIRRDNTIRNNIKTNGTSKIAIKNNYKNICNINKKNCILHVNDHSVVMSIDNNDAAASLLTMASGFRTIPQQHQNFLYTSSKPTVDPTYQAPNKTLQNKNLNSMNEVDCAQDIKRKHSP